VCIAGGSFCETFLLCVSMCVYATCAWEALTSNNNNNLFYRAHNTNMEVGSRRLRILKQSNKNTEAYKSKSIKHENISKHRAVKHRNRL